MTEKRNGFASEFVYVLWLYAFSKQILFLRRKLFNIEPEPWYKHFSMQGKYT